MSFGEKKCGDKLKGSKTRFPAQRNLTWGTPRSYIILYEFDNSEAF